MGVGGGGNVGHSLSPPVILFLLRICSSNDDIITIMGYDLPRTQTSLDLYKQTSKQELVYTKKKESFPNWRAQAIKTFLR